MSLEAVVDEAARRVLEESDGDSEPGLYAPIVAAAIRHLVAQHAEDPAGELQVCFGLDPDTAGQLVELGAEGLDDNAVIESVEEILSEYLYDEDACGGFEGRVFEGTSALAWYDSSSFAVMTAGSGGLKEVRWRGKVFVRAVGGEDAPLNTGGYQLAYRTGDEAERRTAILRIIEEMGGLMRGTSFRDDIETEFAHEIRRITEASSYYREELAGAIGDFVDSDFDFLEEHVEEFARTNDVPESDARRVLERLTEELEPQDQAERDALWRIWLDVRSG